MTMSPVAVAQGVPFGCPRPTSTTLPLTENLMVTRSTRPRSWLIALQRKQGGVECGHFGAVFARVHPARHVAYVFPGALWTRAMLDAARLNCGPVGCVRVSCRRGSSRRAFRHPPPSRVAGHLQHQQGQPVLVEAEHDGRLLLRIRLGN